MKRVISGLIAVAIFAVASSSPRAGPLDVPVGTNLRRTVTVEVAQKTKDSVVYIKARKMVSQRVNPLGNDPLAQMLPQLQRMQRSLGASLGCGFIVHPDGYIVTNHHVIDSARQIDVELLDGRSLQAEIISSNPDADLAILRIRSDKPLPAIELGDSSDLMIGEPVIAVGNPLGLSHTVSTGIVSALHRDITANNEVILGDLIQTDAAINKGNSGGPLLNAYGQVIGINTAIRGDAQNIGFAIAVNRLRDMIPDLMNPAQVTKVDVPLKLMEKRELTPPSTVKATVCRAPDQIPVLSIAGEQPRDLIDAYAILLRRKADQKFEVALASGEKITVDPKGVPLPNAIVKARERLGMTIEEVTPMLAEKYGLSEENGLLVTQVARESAAAKAGIRPGDVIVQLGNYWSLTLETFSVLLEHMPQSGRVRVGILRNGRLGYGYFEL
jgi:serine protease Do